jgi:hypothetical protein
VGGGASVFGSQKSAVNWIENHSIHLFGIGTEAHTHSGALFIEVTAKDELDHAMIRTRAVVVH